MRELVSDGVEGNIPLASGCFMFFRTKLLRVLDGFSPDYFLYFEDYDLSMRVHELSDIVYVPMVRITHFGGHAAGKGLRHIWMFSVSAYRFFSRWGWRWW
ncbi:MAG TPA: hypothetical protein EYO59_05890 [Chromatiaceae bacterium]|nr:hypothetical protein [Chromatiaceae bacterium]